MELLKKLEEAKSHGLSKEEFFQLLDFEVKLTENARQDSSLNVDAGAGKGSEDLVKLLEKVCHQLSQHQTLPERCKHTLEQFQQQQQEFHNRLYNSLNKLSDRIAQQHQQLLQEHQQLQGLGDQKQETRHKLRGQDKYGKYEEKLDQTVQRLRDNIHELRDIVLNKLEDGYSSVKCDLSQAQLKIQKAMLRMEEDMKANKETLTRLESTLNKKKDWADCDIVEGSLDTEDNYTAENKLPTKNLTEIAKQANKLTIGYIPASKQTFRFEIANCMEKSKSDHEWYSPPWHLEQLGSGVAGLVSFDGTGDLWLSLVKACDSSRMGFGPKVRFTSNVWLIDPNHYEPDESISSKSHDFDGQGWEEHLGKVEKQRLKGFLDDSDMLILVFDFEML